MAGRGPQSFKKRLKESNARKNSWKRLRNDWNVNFRSGLSRIRTLRLQEGETELS